MPAIAAADFANPSDAYRRQARRLRCHYAGQPAMLHLALKALARASPVTTGQSVAVSSARSGPARQFVDFLMDRAPTTVLRYSQRLELLRAARRFGIDRFEANLLIASVLERHRRTCEETPAPHRGSSMLGAFAAFLMVQGAVVLGAWWMMFR